eukprot:Pgem_evm2s4968
MSFVTYEFFESTNCTGEIFGALSIALNTCSSIPPSLQHSLDLSITQLKYTKAGDIVNITFFKSESDCTANVNSERTTPVNSIPFHSHLTLLTENDQSSEGERSTCSLTLVVSTMLQ